MGAPFERINLGIYALDLASCPIYTKAAPILSALARPQTSLPISSRRWQFDCSDLRATSRRMNTHAISFAWCFVATD